MSRQDARIARERAGAATAEQMIAEARERAGQPVADGPDRLGQAVLAQAVLDIAAAGGMPDSFWLTDHRIALACEVLGITPVEAREQHL